MAHGAGTDWPGRAIGKVWMFAAEGGIMSGCDVVLISVLMYGIR
jgi:hypothetical protein